MVFGWDEVRGAEVYEACHQCAMDVDKDGKNTLKKGTPIEVKVDNKCGVNKYCIPVTDPPVGLNTFHVRVKHSASHDWSSWSDERTFIYNAGEHGLLYHGGGHGEL